MPVFLKYGDKIKGDTKDPAHRGWIVVESAQMRVGRNISVPVGRSANREQGSSNVTEITVTKKIDRSSPLLLQEALGGQAVLAVIEFTRGDGSVYLRLEMSGTMISSFNVSGGGQDAMESLSLNFTKIEFKNLGIDREGAPVTPSWP